MAAERSLILSCQDKVRKSHQSTAEFAGGVSVETSLCTTGVIMGKVAGATERSGIVDQRNNRFGSHGVKFFFFQDLGDQCSCITMAVFHRVNEGQRDFAFFQVTENRLSELLGRGREI